MKLAKTISLISLLSRFPDEASVVAAFEKWRWGDTPECPRCGQSKTHPRPWRHGHWCCGCRKCFTVRTGMVFENSRLPLRQWLLAMYLMLTARKGIPATQLKEKLGVTYRTAWFGAYAFNAASSVITGKSPLFWGGCLSMFARCLFRVCCIDVYNNDGTWRNVAFAW